MARSTLGRAATDLFAFVSLFHEAPSEQRGDAGSLRGQLMTLLEGFANHPAAAGVSPVEREEARFALVAFADEMILSSNWSRHGEWLAEPLQLKLFHTNRGGDEFFERLARLRAEYTDAREVFFLCLAFGFEGQYADRAAERHALLVQQFEMLRVAGRAADVATLAPLSPAAYEVEITLPSRRARGILRPLLAIGLVAASVFAILYAALQLAGARVPPPGV
jgi:type VI secretion system protein ImpK